MGKLSALWDLAKKEGADLADDAASRMARAAEQGFDVDTPLYRGSRSDERYQGQFYTPDPDYAAQYANLKTWKPDDDRPNVGKFYAEKPFSLKDNANTIEDFKSWYAQDQGRVPGDLIGDSGEVSYFYANKLADYLGETRGARPPALLIDEANGQVATKVYKEGGVRSVNAMFDPSKRTSTDLLAGLGGTAAIGASVAPEDAEAATTTALAPEMYRQMEETRRVVSDFAQRRAPKASFWKQKRDELLELAGAGIGAAVNAGINTIASNPVGAAMLWHGGNLLEASQQPVQGVSALSALIASGDLDTAANVARMPQEQIADEAGGLVTDYLSQAGYPKAGALAGTAANVGINMAGF